MKNIILVCVLVLVSFSNSSWAQLSFKSALEISVKKNIDYTKATNSLHNSKISKLQSFYNFAPSLTFSSGKMKTSDHYSDVFSEQTNTTSFSLSYNLLSFGEDYYNYKGAEKYLEASKKNKENTVIAIEANALRVLLSFIKAKRDIQIYQKILKIQKQAKSIALKRFKAGFLSRQDVDKVEIDFNNFTAEYNTQKISLNTIVQSIKEYIGDVNLSTEWPWEKEFSTKEYTKIAVHKFEVESIPSWKLASLSLQTYELYKKAAQRRMLGSVDLSINRSMSEVYGSERNWGWTASITYTLPLFDRLSSYGSYQKSLGNYYVKKAELYYANRESFAFYQKARSNFKISLETFNERQKTLKLTKRLYKDSIKQFNRGRLSVNDLLVEQKRLLLTEQNANQGNYQRHISLADLCHSIGSKVTGSCL